MKYLVMNNFTVSLNLSYQIQEIFKFLIPIQDYLLTKLRSWAEKQSKILSPK